jgi:hypothetical protein
MMSTAQSAGLVLWSTIALVFARNVLAAVMATVIFKAAVGVDLPSELPAGFWAAGVVFVAGMLYWEATRFGWLAARALVARLCLAWRRRMEARG